MTEGRRLEKAKGSELQIAMRDREGNLQGAVVPSVDEESGGLGPA